MFGMTEEQERVGLGAMKAVAMVHGLTDEERDLVRACADALGLSVNVDTLPIATPDELARAFREDLWQKRVVQALVATAMVDGEATREELAVIDSYAKALGVEDAWLRNLHRVVDGHLMRLRLDVFRRAPIARQAISEAYQEEGLRGVWRLIKAARGRGDLDPDLAWRFKQLGLLPAGTLGRAFWEHMTERRFAFPGEAGAIVPLRGVHHDLTHILTGYSTEPDGECQIAAFYAGYKGDDPFVMIFATLLMFQLGIALNPGVITPAKMQWDPEKAIRAMRCGAGINTDLTDHWDFWPDLERPIDELRLKYNIVAP